MLIGRAVCSYLVLALVSCRQGFLESRLRLLVTRLEYVPEIDVRVVLLPSSLLLSLYLCLSVCLCVYVCVCVYVSHGSTLLCATVRPSVAQ